MPAWQERTCPAPPWCRACVVTPLSSAKSPLPPDAGAAPHRGDRLPCPPEMAAALSRHQFRSVTVEWRGRSETRMAWARDVLWYGVRPKAMVRFVVVRDPTGVERDDFFFTTDLDMEPTEVLSVYAGRWAIEVTYRDVKQLVGGEQLQSWKGEGPERAAHLSFWLHGTVWLWYLANAGATPPINSQPWYATKRVPSFADAMAELRHVLWRERKSPRFRASTAHSRNGGRSDRRPCHGCVVKASSTVIAGETRKSTTYVVSTIDLRRKVVKRIELAAPVVLLLGDDLQL